MNEYVSDVPGKNRHTKALFHLQMKMFPKQRNKSGMTKFIILVISYSKHVCRRLHELSRKRYMPKTKQKRGLLQKFLVITISNAIQRHITMIFLTK